MFPIGRQRVGIVTETASGVVSELMEPVTTESVVWVDGCLFESLTRKVAEDQSSTVTTSEPAWVVMPVTTATKAITSSMVLRHNNRDYVMRGDAVLEFDIHGVPQYVFCHCERQTG